MDTNALFKIGYGLYILTANDGTKDNGCVINTAMQLTSNPCQIEVVVNKLNYTCSIIQKTKKFNVSVLSDEAKFDVFERFGYKSGKDINKFEDFSDAKRSENGLLYITKNTNAYFGAVVEREIDLGSHVLFIARLVEAEVLSDEKTVTYDFYQKNIKPQPQKEENKTSGWRCKICGYVLENENLPGDFICPLCKHGAIDFEKI